MADAKPPPPAAGNPAFTTTVTVQYPTGTPDLGTFYIFNGTGKGAPGTMPSVGAIPDNNALILGLNVGLTVLALFVVGIRLFARIKFSRTGIDDYFICISQASAFVIMAFNIHNVHLGMGKHIGDLDDSYAQQIERFHWYSQIIYCISLGSTKLSMLALMVRLHPQSVTQLSWMRKLVFALIVFVATYSITSMVTIIFTCHPINGIWNSMVATKCLNRQALLFSISALNVFSDLVIVLLPLPMLYSVQINIRQKVLVGILLGASLVVCAASAVRMSTLSRLAWSSDVTWDMAKFSAWTALEFDLAIICASVPALTPLAKHYVPKLLGYSFKSSVDSGRQRETGTLGTFHTISADMEASNNCGRGRNRMSSILTKISAGGDNGQPGKKSTSGDRRKTMLQSTDVELKSFYDDSGGSDEHIVDHSGIIQTIEVDIASESAEDSKSFYRGARAGLY